MWRTGTCFSSVVVTSPRLFNCYKLSHFRAEKMITKFEDPNAAPNRAPMYKSDAQVLEDVRRDNPELLEEMVAKDDKLLDRLKTVYVSSSDAQPEPELNPDKPLPIDVRQHYVVSI